MKKQILNEISRDLFSLIPVFHEKLIRPSEGLLSDGLSRIQFFALNTIKMEELISMTELSVKMEMPKQQMTKIINRLCEIGFVARVYDNKDRRIIRISLTDKGESYLVDYIDKMLVMISRNIGKLEAQDIEDIKSAIETLNRILSKIDKIQT